MSDIWIHRHTPLTLQSFFVHWHSYLLQTFSRAEKFIRAIREAKKIFIKRMRKRGVVIKIEQRYRCVTLYNNNKNGTRYRQFTTWVWAWRGLHNITINVKKVLVAINILDVLPTRNIPNITKVHKIPVHKTYGRTL